MSLGVVELVMLSYSTLDMDRDLYIYVMILSLPYARTSICFPSSTSPLDLGG
jgi:hypothetical protein